MSSRICVLALLVVAVVCLPGAAYPDSGPSSHGGGSTFIPDRTIFGGTAVTHQDGTVTGQFNVRVTTTGEFVKAEVQCLDVSVVLEGGYTATTSGVITKGFISGLGDLTGQCYVSTGWDRGEGANSPPDRVSFLVVAPCSIVVPDTACFDLPQPAILPLDGNLQVKP